MRTPLELLKFNLQEKQYPYFEDKDLELLLEINNNDVEKASYEGCILKAIADDGIEVAGIKLQSNRAYWLTLAEHFKEKQKILKEQISVERVDED